MRDLVSIEELVGAEFHNVTLVGEKIPLLESKREGATLRFAQAFFRDFIFGMPESHLTIFQQTPEFRQYLFNEVESLVRLGAIAARIRSPESNVYEFASGAAISTVSYSLLTGESANAIDTNEIRLREAQAIANGTGARLDCINSKVQDFMSEVELKPQDTVIASSLPLDVFRYLRSLEALHKIISITYELLEDEVLTNIKSEYSALGYEVKVALNNPFGKFVKPIGVFGEPPSSYVLLATPGLGHVAH